MEFDIKRYPELEMLGWEPTWGQAPILVCRKRFILVSGGEGSGKSQIAEKHALLRIWESEEGKLFWLAGDDYAQVEREFAYLRADLATLGLLDVKRSTERVDPGRLVTVDGRRIETKSLRDEGKIGRDGPDGVVVCEAGLISWSAYMRLQGRVARNRGWMFLCGTLELGNTSGWFPTLKKVWASGAGDSQSFSLPTYSNTFSFPGGLEDPEIKRIEAATSDEYFRLRIMGEIVPPQGLVFPEFRPDIHVKDVSWVGEETPVYIWEDPGYGSSAHAVEVAQVIDGQVQVFDEIYLKGKITSEIIQVCQVREWWKSPKFLVSDPFYKDQHHSQRSVAETWVAETGLVAGGERVPIVMGIERVKTFLKVDPLSGESRLAISPRCEGLLSEFGMVPNPLKGPDYGNICAYKWRVDGDGRVVGEVPEDRYNDAIKALTCGLVWQFGYARDNRRSVIKVKRHGGFADALMRRGSVR